MNNISAIIVCIVGLSSGAALVGADLRGSYPLPLGPLTLTANVVKVTADVAGGCKVLGIAEHELVTQATVKLTPLAQAQLSEGILKISVADKKVDFISGQAWGLVSLLTSVRPARLGYAVLAGSVVAYAAKRYYLVEQEKKYNGATT